jgi:hypothetical protein
MRLSQEPLPIGDCRILDPSGVQSGEDPACIMADKTMELEHRQ